MTIQSKVTSLERSKLRTALTQIVESEKAEMIKKIESMYPLSFSRDMGSYREAIRGVREIDHLREATNEEEKIVNSIIKLIK